MTPKEVGEAKIAPSPAVKDAGQSETKMVDKRLLSKRPCPAPRWVKRAFASPGGGWMVPHGGWLDHVGYCGNTLISEPYGPLASRHVRDLVRFSEEHGLEFEISAASGHYPTRTLAIFVYPATVGADAVIE